MTSEPPHTKPPLRPTPTTSRLDLSIALGLLWLLSAPAIFAADTPPVSNNSHPITAAPSTATTVTDTPATPNPAAAANMETLDDKQKLGLGDKLSFRIIEDLEDPKPLIVTDSGDVEVPYIGRFPALDKTCRQLAREIKTELEKEYYYQATVIIAVDLLSKSRGKVYLVGSIRLPGPQEVPTDEVFTLSKAIMRAGGFGDFADKKHVKVTRKRTSDEAKNLVLTVNLVEVIEKGKTDKDLKLEAGDLIYVPSRTINF
jgi:polysaccharide export outer membrane protein